MSALAGFAGLLVAVAIIAAGLVMVGFGQVFGALKEIALNTRAMAYGANPAAAPRDGYAGLEFIATAMMAVGGGMALLGLGGVALFLLK